LHVAVGYDVLAVGEYVSCVLIGAQ